MIHASMILVFGNNVFVPQVHIPHYFGQEVCPNNLNVKFLFVMSWG